MRQTLLISIAAVALAAGSTLALSQGGGQGGAGGAGVSGGSINANPSGGAVSGGASGGAAGSTSRDSQSMDAVPGAKKGAQERTAPSQKSTQQERTQPGTQQRQTESPQQGKEGAQPGDTKGSKQGAQTGDTKGQDTKQGAGQGSMTSSSVSLTTEQKTTIRNTVITSGPKITSVNFDLKVGVAVPRSVRVAPVPVTLIEIQPAWRGYMYFVYEDEIVIVEPRTLKIVAVIEI